MTTMAAAGKKAGVIDCDIHPALKSPRDLFPWLERRWQAHLASYGPHVRQATSAQQHYPRMMASGMRADAYPSEGGPPGSSLDLLRQQHLDPNHVEVGMLFPLSRGGMEERNPDLAAALSRAMNEWQIETFLRPESRLRGGIVVPQENPAAAVAEIERRADDGRFVQVIMSTRASEPLGNRKYWPIYAAADAAGLPLGLHPAGYAGGHASTGSGWPSFYFQEHYSFVPGTESVLTSLVIEGVFEQFPRLRVALIEGGFSWAPALCWRMDNHWQRFRDEVPHLKKPPSSYVRTQVWWATQPVDEPKNRSQMLDVIDWIGWDRLIYSSDYPHWDFDDPQTAFKFPRSEEQKAMLYRRNAQTLYGLA